MQYGRFAYVAAGSACLVSLLTLSIGLASQADKFANSAQRFRRRARKMPPYLLLGPDKRVSEAAYEAGFQSLSQFNRVFRRIVGESPSAYRERLHRRGQRQVTELADAAERLDFPPRDLPQDSIQLFE